MLKTSLKICLTLGISFMSLAVKAQTVKQINFADPSVFYHAQTYYLYGTVEEKNWAGGFKVYTSKDKKTGRTGGKHYEKALLLVLQVSGPLGFSVSRQIFHGLCRK